ncbi:MAG: hypothetical protein HQL53_06025, partial [Magnetococcales bacterium]|nr:hypothetical protein [Magnetococcales bacterium]
QALETEERKEELQIDQRLAALASMPEHLLIPLAEKGIVTLDDFADLAADELLEELGEEAPTQEAAAAMILEARHVAGWFDDGEAVPEAPVASGESEVSEAPEEAVSQEGSKEETSTDSDT